MQSNLGWASGKLHVKSRLRCSVNNSNTQAKPRGEVAEWLNAPDSKSGIRVLPYRGFESPLLRQIKNAPQGAFFIWLSKGRVRAPLGSVSEYCSRKTPEGRSRAKRGMARATSRLGTCVVKRAGAAPPKSCASRVRLRCPRTEGLRFGAALAEATPIRTIPPSKNLGPAGSIGPPSKPLPPLFQPLIAAGLKILSGSSNISIVMGYIPNNGS